jgi:hypothetical protein
MKKLVLFMFAIIAGIQLQAQEPKQEPNPKKFHIGVSYSYTQTDMKLLYMTEQYTWNDKSSGLQELDQEGIDEMNSRETFTRSLRGLSLEAGMILLDKPESKWHIEGTFMIGIASSRYRVQNNQLDTLEMEINSGFSLPAFGLQFKIGYQFNPHWGIAAVPHVGYSFGVNKNIEDNTYGHIEFFNETRKCYYSYLYGRISLLATFRVKTLTIGVGPGFYLLYNSNDYQLQRVNPANGDTYSTELKTRLISKSFLDGDVFIDWRIVPFLSLSAYAAIGNDLTARGSIRYNF